MAQLKPPPDPLQVRKWDVLAAAGTTAEVVGVFTYTGDTINEE